MAIGDYLISEEHQVAVLEDLQQLGQEEDEPGELQEKKGVYKRNRMCAQAARNWLWQLGFWYRDVKKRIMELMPLVVEWEKNGKMIEKLAMPGQNLLIQEAGMNALHQKTRGKGIIVYTYLFPHICIYVPKLIIDTEMIMNAEDYRIPKYAGSTTATPADAVIASCTAIIHCWMELIAVRTKAVRCSCNEIVTIPWPSDYSRPL
ncbi:hypothetical protein RUND412_002362 [Rhizina undulata]